jgi:excisionase family DNA binding protein
MTPLFITTREASTLLGISIQSVQELCAAKVRGFPAVRFGKKYLISTSLLEEWAKNVTQDGGGPLG